MSRSRIELVTADVIVELLVATWNCQVESEVAPPQY